MRAEREFNDAQLVPGTRYRVVRRIGVGGMGSVYEVEHLELGKRFVLKALQSTFAERDDLVQRLRTEWRALGRLEHPNIVSVTDAGTTANRIPYYVMERLNGETLAARLRRDRKLPLSDALGVAADVADGLAAAHRIGIVHRDVKPPNVFLVAGAGAKLLDFGIAKILDSKAQITGRGVTLGTPRYMSPEQATGGEVDGRTDLYALGLLLFEMISGVGPFDDARDGDELFLSHVTKTPPPLNARAPSASKDLVRLVAQLLEKKPSDRPHDASAVAALVRDLIPRAERLAVRWSEDDLATTPGGPFDTLEGAATAASEPQSFGRMARYRGEERTATRTHPMSGPPSLRDATNRTVPLSEQPDDEPETRTSGGPHQRRPQEQALPEPRNLGETPPPVESSHEASASRSAPQPPRAFGWAAVLVLVGAAMVVSGSYWALRGRAPSAAVESTAASQPVSVSEPSRAEPPNVPAPGAQDPVSADRASADEVLPPSGANAPPALPQPPPAMVRARAGSRAPAGQPPEESTPAELPGAETGGLEGSAATPRPDEPARAPSVSKEAPIAPRRAMPSSGL